MGVSNGSVAITFKESNLSSRFASLVTKGLNPMVQKGQLNTPNYTIPS
jgi:hypothetical protein